MGKRRRGDTIANTTEKMAMLTLSQEAYIREIRITTTRLCISYKEDVAVSELNSTYFHILSGIRDFLADSAGALSYSNIYKAPRRLSTLHRLTPVI